jgi:hypothetical protein
MAMDVGEPLQAHGGIMAPASGTTMENLPRRRIDSLAAALAAVVLLSAPASAQRAAPTYPQVKAASVVPEYAAVLRALDPAQPASILKARDAALSTYAKAASDDADAVFRQFQAFYNEALSNVPYAELRSPLNTLLTAICEGRLHACDAAAADAFLRSARPEDVELRNASDAGAVADLARYRAHGIWFLWGEGDWYAAPDPSFVASVANKLPLGEIGAWVTFWAAEQKERVAEDASILIGWEGVRRRLARWEAFARAHPPLPETQVEVQPHVVWLVALYVFGTSNTPAYDTRFGGMSPYDVRASGGEAFGTGAAGGQATGARGGTRREPTLRIDPQLTSSYDRFLVQNRDSAYYTAIDGIVTRLRASGGVLTKELADFLRAELTDPYFTPWLRAADRWVGR